MGLKYFPKGFKPSTNQQYAIPNIVNAFKDHKFVVIQGPTGCGKSFIAKTIANSLNKLPTRLTKLINNYTAFETTWENNRRVYEYADDFNNGKRYGTSILTTTKALQDQYTRDFEDIKPLKGKGSYIYHDFSLKTVGSVRQSSPESDLNFTKNLQFLAISSYDSIEDYTQPFRYLD